MRAVCSIGLVAILSCSVVGCGDDEVVGPGPGDGEETTVAKTPSEWLDAFEAAWQQRDGQAYEDLLHPFFVFTLAPDDAASAGLGPDWGRATELDAFAGLFSDSTETGPVAEFFQIVEIDLDGRWTEDFAPDVTPEADLRAQLSLRATVDLGAGTSTVVGRQVFYLARGRATVDGREVDRHRLVAWQDLGAAAARAGASRADDSFSWTVLKSLGLPAGRGPSSLQP